MAVNANKKPTTGSSVTDMIQAAMTPTGRTTVTSNPAGQRAVNAMDQKMVLEDAAYRAANTPRVNTSTVSAPVYNRAAILGNLNRSKAQTGTQEYVDMLDRLNASTYKTPAAAAPKSFSSSADYNAYYQNKQKPMKKGGAVKSKPTSASKRADGIASKGKTKGRMV